MTVAEALRQVCARLAPVAGDGARHEAEQMLQQALGCSRSDLILAGSTLLMPALSSAIEGMTERRLVGEPLAYILGAAYFHSRSIAVTPDVLIPRPDTEVLIETIVAGETDGPERFCDLGTGSGCILSVLLGVRPTWRGIGIDISIDALTVAQENCPTFTSLMCADMFEALKAGQLLDFVVSNPPYVTWKELADLDPQVRDFEPHVALDGGPDGLRFYRTIAQRAPAVLKSGGRVYCEIGSEQGHSVPDVFTSHKWCNVNMIRDLAGRPRVVTATWAGDSFSC